jgi:hypothetical protein
VLTFDKSYQTTFSIVQGYMITITKTSLQSLFDTIQKIYLKYDEKKPKTTNTQNIETNLK